MASGGRQPSVFSNACNTRRADAHRSPTMLASLDPPASGAANMAADEALLNAAAEGRAAGRWYRWSEPTVSLGHFQKGAAFDPAGLPDLPRVRRLSGGGAIVHHFEWTYALAVPRGHRLARSPETFYEAVHGDLIAALAAAGVEARLRGAGDRGADARTLCFLRADPRDVVVTDAAGVVRKVVGSAQRRRRGAVLQHGSLLLAASPHAPEIPGLIETAGLTLPAGRAVVRDAAARFGRLLAVG